ncbi:MAG: hypothetical protein ACYC0L_05585 [Thermoleophilia bacterium]
MALLMFFYLQQVWIFFVVAAKAFKTFVFSLGIFPRRATDDAAFLVKRQNYQPQAAGKHNGK